MPRILPLLLAWLWLAFVPLVASAQVGRVPPPAQVREAERIARLFLAGDSAALVKEFAPSLGARFGLDEVGRLSRQVRDRGGEMKYIQAPWVREESPGRLVLVVPIDLERADMDLVLEWDTAGNPWTLRGIWAANRSRRPVPGIDARNAAGPAFRDAEYIDRDAFTDQVIKLDPARFDPREIVLSQPKRAEGGRMPVVIVLPAKGVADVDGSVGRNKPLRDLAHGLASRGVAVVRMAPRPTESSRDLETHAMGEARALVALARGSAWADPGSVYTLGFHEGAHLAFELARTETWMGGSIMLSPPAIVDLSAELTHQRFLADAGIVGREYVDFLTTLRDRDEMHQSWPSDLFHDAPFSLWQEFAGIDPLRRIVGASGEFLVIFGGHDYLAVHQDRKTWSELDRGLNTLWVRTEPGASRWMIAGEGSPSTDLTSAGHVSRAVIERIAGFVKATGLRQGAREKPVGPIR